MTTPPSERRLHPLSFAFAMARHGRQLLLPGLLVLLAGARGDDSWQAWAMLLFIPYTIGSVIRMRAFRYELGADELILHSGVIVRQERHVPYRRIQNIDGVQNVVHRLLGVIDVRLETAGGEEPEAHLSVISQPAFAELRQHVDTHRGQPVEHAASPAVPATETADAATNQLLTLPPRELAICGLIQGRGLLAISALFGILWESGLLDRLSEPVFGSKGGGVVRQAVKAMFGQGIPPFRRIAFSVAAFVALLLVMRMLSMGWALLRLHGFTVTRTGDDLRIDFGLFTRVAATIPIRRIQSVTVLEGPWHRAFGRVSVHVNTAGGQGDDAVKLQREWLAPVIKPAEVPRLLQEIAPSIDLDAIVWQPVDPRGVRRLRTVGLVIAAMASIAFVGMLQWRAMFLFAAVAVLGDVDARRSVRALAWSITPSGFMFRSGWIWRRQTFAPFSKIQAVLLHETPFDRRYAMARVEVETAGTARDRHEVRVPYLARPVGEQLAAQLAAQAANTTFRW
jgi:putative membrane protein